MGGGPANPTQEDHAFAAESTAWTLKFKLGCLTVMLHVDPQTPFPAIRQQLLHAIHNTPTLPTLPEGTTLPDDPDDIEFGVAVDRLDLSKGWLPLEIPDEGSKKAKKGILNESPMGAGLRDGTTLAVRLKDGEEADAERKWTVVIPQEYDEEEED